MPGFKAPTDGGISVFSIGGNGVLTFEETYQSKGFNPVWATFDGTGNYLYILDRYSEYYCQTGAATCSNPNPSNTHRQLSRHERLCDRVLGRERYGPAYLRTEQCRPRSEEQYSDRRFRGSLESRDGEGWLRQLPVHAGEHDRQRRRSAADLSLCDRHQRAVDRGDDRRVPGTRRDKPYLDQHLAGHVRCSLYLRDRCGHQPDLFAHRRRFHLLPVPD